VAVLALVTSAALALRLLNVALATRQLAFNDGLTFHVQANLIADGYGFIDPLRFGYAFVQRPTAAHPPLFPLLLSGVSWLGFHSVLAHQVACAVMSAAAVPLLGLAAIEVAGPRAGLATAAIAAVYPNLWVSDTVTMSESLYVSTIALALWMLCRFSRRPTAGGAVLAGAAIALAALTRAEAAFLLPLALVPLALGLRTVRSAQRAGLIGVALAASMVVVAPWVVRNLVTFDRPVFLASDTDSVIAGANCHDTYYGRDLGSWQGSGCNDAPLPRGDESVEGAELRARGLHYARTHLSRVPLVVAARVGRALDLYRPLQGLADTRTRWVRRFAVASFVVLLPFAVIGAVHLRRASVSLIPFAAVAVLVIVSAAVGYGLWRLRFPLDEAVVVLAGVGLVNLHRLRGVPPSSSAPRTPT
jgi:4-amino-4-deoxy-L-arabinose transferase-like glycosyltransferase